MGPVDTADAISRFDQLIHEGGPFVIVAFVLVTIMVATCYLIYKYVAQPALELGKAAATAAASATSSAESAAREARLAADAANEAAKIAHSMQETNRQLFEAIIGARPFNQGKSTHGNH